MGYVKEPAGVDLIVGPSVFTEEDKAIVSQAIATYKATHPPLPRDLNEALHLLQPEETAASKQRVRHKKTAAM